MTAVRTHFSGRLRFFLRLVAFDIFTFRVIAAGKEGAVASFFRHHLASAFRADLLHSIFILILTFGIAAFRKVDAGDKFTETPDAIHQVVPAVRTFFSGALQLLLFHILICILQQRFKFIIEGTNLFNIVSLSCRNLVQVMLHIRRIGYVDDAAEEFLQLGVGQLALFTGDEDLRLTALTWALQRDIAAGLQCINDDCIGGRTSNSLFLQILDQAGLTVAKRRLGEVLLTFQLNILERFLFFHDWQHFILNSFIIAVDFQITVKGKNGAVGTELTAIGYDLYIDHIAFAWRH